MTSHLRRALVAGNWKMHTAYEEAVHLAREVATSCSDASDVEVVLIPPFPWIVTLAELVRGSMLSVGAQNCSVYERGAYTGEVAAFMLAPFCRYVIVGHSERRHLFGETDEIVAAKLARVFAHGMTPILCVGERLEEREAGQTLAVVERQLATAAASIDRSQAGRLVVAYEPVWAIGTGRPATAADAQEVARFIRGWLTERYGERAGRALRVLYGGSVTADNAGTFFSEPDIDGALVGGASLDAAQFCGIVGAARVVARAKKGA
ncbi:triose-phosphate isomerase [Thermomicrobium sp. 4228-Ro]|uniref:triose-phosphate isomerase n=1 Tax=Thermomicrobium sp. 4228-Ro TaxID=2993937 RepID=UPI0022499FCD|nr:triose-phosphate isomerase [Thermomicrobium sp. 4228-Ro]MCX2726130.1 triose-phosphate isomerase [Thermomicrobium sp. 4228-Ro]